MTARLNGQMLPDGWMWTSLDDITDSIQYGHRESASTQKIGPKFLRITDIQDGQVDWSSVPYCKCSDAEQQKYQLAPGDIVFARTGATTGKSYLIQSCPDAVFASYLIRLRVADAIYSKYLSTFFESSSYWSQITQVKKGSAQPGVNATILSTLRLPLAPLNEQHRIVEAIETQFTRLDVAVTALKRSQANLKRYRAAVLKAACEGRLVPTEAKLAQAEGRSYEPAAVLLEHVARLRSQSLEEGYPNEAEARTQQRKQRQQFLPKGLPRLPIGWTWATLMQCTLILVDCHNKTAPYTDSGVILLRTSNVRNGKLLLDDVTYITEKTFEQWAARATPQAGDILITREAPMGEVCIIPDGIQVCMGQRMMLIRVVPETILREFLLYSLQDPDFMQRVQDKPVGVTVQHLRVGGIETLLVPVPPLAEQHRIVAEVERRLSLIDQLEKTIKTDLARANRLRQSILKQAFAGLLVPQDPTDEPAAALLERIQANHRSMPQRLPDAKQ